MQGGRKQYGLQLQIKGPAKKSTARPAPVPAFRFGDGNDEENVEDDIARQANKKRVVREVEEQYKKALEEDPWAFDYDGVYDEMKGNQARPIQEDRAKRESKYIGKLLEKAKVRAREQDVVYERQLAKERQKEDHLYGDKEKFVTTAYKKKLIEQQKWLEEERRRELEEQKHEVTNKSDMSDFYRNLLKNNEAFGGRNVSESGEKTLAAEAERQRSQLPSENEETKPSISKPADIDPRTALGRDENFLEEPRGEVDTKPSRSGSESNHVEKSRSLSANHLQSRDSVNNNADKANMRVDHEDNADNETSERLRTEISVVVKDSKSGEAEAVRASAVDSVAAAKERYLARKRQRGL